MRDALRDMRRAEDKFVYSTVVVPSLEDALIAVMFNYNIQSVVIRNDFNIESGNKLDMLRATWTALDEERIDEIDPESAARSCAGCCARCARSWMCSWSPTARSRTSPAATWAAAAGCSTTRKTTSSCTSISCAGCTRATRRRSSPRSRNIRKQPTGVFHAMPISPRQVDHPLATGSATWASSTA